MNGRQGRRQFLRKGGGAISALGLAPALAGAQPATISAPAVSGAGWEVTNINNNGADMYVKVVTAMTLNVIDVDIAFVITSTPSTAGGVVLYCTGAVSRGAAPTFSGGSAEYFYPATDSNFGSVQIYNPNSLTVSYSADFTQPTLFAVDLKTWVPTDGTASATFRHLTTEPSLSLNAGDYLVFHMNHAGVPGDAEMQIVLAYS